MYVLEKIRFIEVLCDIKLENYNFKRGSMDIYDFKNGKGEETLFSHVYDLWHTLNEDNTQYINFYAFCLIFKGINSQQLYEAYWTLTNKHQILKFDAVCEFCSLISGKELCALMRCFVLDRTRKLSIQSSPAKLNVSDKFEEDDLKLEKHKRSKMQSPLLSSRRIRRLKKPQKKKKKETNLKLLTSLDVTDSADRVSGSDSKETSICDFCVLI